MRVLVACLLLSGCYLSHSPSDSASDAGSDVGSDTGSCEAPAGLFIRNDCSFCNAYHYSWLNVCEQVYVTSTNGLVAIFDASECGELELSSCSIWDMCVAPDACDGLDVSTFDELLAMRTRRSPRGGETSFQPYTGDEPFGDPPSCAELATLPRCD